MWNKRQVKRIFIQTVDKFCKQKDCKNCKTNKHVSFKKNHSPSLPKEKNF